MRTIVFFLEEPSAKEMLQGVLHRILPDEILIRYVVFQGKQDLEKNLKIKLRAWTLPNCSFVVMRDQDSGDCKEIKEKLANICEKAGRKGVLIRIACHELESFYLGDLAAVEKGLDLKGIERKKKSNENSETLICWQTLQKKCLSLPTIFMIKFPVLVQLLPI